MQPVTAIPTLGRFAALPEELTKEKAWLVADENKWPHYLDHRKRSTNHTTEDIDSWANIEDAVRCLLTHPDKYICLSFACHTGYNLTWLDFDNCVNPQTKQIDERVLKLIQGTYAEFSFSGNGIRAVYKGILPPLEKIEVEEEPDLEFFSDKKQMTITGRKLDSAPSSIAFLPLHVREAHEIRRAKKDGRDIEILPKIEIVGDALAYMTDHLDLFRDYTNWVNLGIALSCYKGTPDEEMAGNFFLTISRLEAQASGRSHDPQAVERKWKLLQSRKGGLRPSSILWLAKQKQWTPPPESREERRQRQRDEAVKVGRGDHQASAPIIADLMTLDEMIERLVLVAEGARVYDLKTHQVFPLPEARSIYASSTTEIVDDRGKVKTVQCLNLWIADPRRKMVYGITWAPDLPRYCEDPNGVFCINTWDGFKKWGCSRERGAEVGLFTDHITYLFKDRAHDFLQWLAHIKQNPSVLPHRAWLHISSYTGTGRNAIGMLLSRILTGYCAPSIDLPAILDGGFNNDLSQKVLAIVDEIQEGGSERWRHAERFKSLLTATHRTINRKYGRMSNEFNCCRFLLFSNHINAIPIVSNDRRIEVVINHHPPLGPEYYEELYAAINDVRFIAKVSDFLDGYDLEGFRPGERPKQTTDREQVVNSSISDQLQDLITFTEHYPFNIATADRFRQAAGIDTLDLASRRGLGHNITAAGWSKLGRYLIDGGQVTIYVRTGHHFDTWKEVEKEHGHRKMGSICKQSLPIQDGGLLAWDGNHHGAPSVEDF